jgi:phage replication-related protein YjqB (UPF0714/DUF867 family)
MSFAELLASAGVVEEVTLASRFGLLAFHGGLEGGTEVVARLAAERSGASLYVVVQPAGLRWHIPSHQVRAEASDALARFLAHVEVCVAIHGYGRVERPRAILLGGSNRRLAAALGARLRACVEHFEIVDDLDDIPAEMRGLHADNPVNRPLAGGVQLELPPGARGAAWRMSERNGTYVPVPGLIEALAATAMATAGRGTGL